ncbi:hypothetical protein V8E36_007593 [Tilletia maclaganii]
MASSTSTLQQVHIILNPASGVPGLSRTLFDSHIEPLLQQHTPTLQLIQHETKADGDGVRVGQEIRRALSASASASHGRQSKVYAILLGGDGTTHEFLNGFLLDKTTEIEHQSSDVVPQIELAVVPTGTANALYAGLHPPQPEDKDASDAGSDEHAWRLRSVRALLNSLSDSANPGAQSTLVPLTLTLASTQSPPPKGDEETNSDKNDRRLLAHIVTSHALHAAILHDSEALRAEHPGIERFKLAAQKNSTVWVSGKLHLLSAATAVDGAPPGAARKVQKYDPAQDAFVDVDVGSEGGGGGVEVDGPFLYLSALTTDRLEPHFVPGPFSTTAALAQATSSSSSATNPHPRPPDSVDIVAIRPLRSPAVRAALAELRAEWNGEAAENVRLQYALGALTSVTQHMYDGGKHVRLTYPPSQAQDREDKGTAGEEGAVAKERLEERGSGDGVVEYWRAAGYEWTPVCTLSMRPSSLHALWCGSADHTQNTQIPSLRLRPRAPPSLDPLTFPLTHDITHAHLQPSTMQLKLIALALALLSASAVLATPAPVPEAALAEMDASHNPLVIRDCNICRVCNNGSECCGGCGKPGGCCGTGN